MKSFNNQKSTWSVSEINTTRIGSHSSHKLSLRKSSHRAHLNRRKKRYKPFGQVQISIEFSIYPILTISKLPLIEHLVITAKESPLVNLQIAHWNMHQLLSKGHHYFLITGNIKYDNLSLP